MRNLFSEISLSFLEPGTSNDLYLKIIELIKNARYKTIKAVNQTMVNTSSKKICKYITIFEI
jgi:hypothetical protein